MSALCRWVGECIASHKVHLCAHLLHVDVASRWLREQERGECIDRLGDKETTDGTIVTSSSTLLNAVKFGVNVNASGSSHSFFSYMQLMISGTCTVIRGQKNSPLSASKRSTESTRQLVGEAILRSQNDVPTKNLFKWTLCFCNSLSFFHRELILCLLRAVPVAGGIWKEEKSNKKHKMTKRGCE